jgi:hypothetical protein
MTQLDYSLPFKAVQPAPNWGNMIQNAMSISDMLDQKKLRGLQMQQVQQQIDAAPQQQADKQAEQQRAEQLRQVTEIGRLAWDIDPTKNPDTWQRSLYGRIAYAVKKNQLPSDILSDFDQITPEHLGQIKQYAPQAKEKEKGAEDKTFNQTRDLVYRFGMEDTVKTFIDDRNAYGKIKAATSSGYNKMSTPEDIGLVYNYMKLVNPQIRLNEGEVATAQNAAGISKTLLIKYNSLRNGATLEPTIRKQYSEAAEKLYQSSLRQFKPVKSRYDKMAEEYGLNKESITGGLEYVPGKKTAQAPGQPADQDPWAKLKEKAKMGDKKAQEFLTSQSESW